MHTIRVTCAQFSVGNATYSGFLCVRVHYRSPTMPGHYVAASVCDTKSGMGFTSSIKTPYGKETLNSDGVY